MQISMTCHTSAPDTSTKERVTRGLKLVMMLKFFTNEYCVLIYGQCGRQARAVQRLYHQRFPGEPHPLRQIIEKTVKRFRDTGSVTHKARISRPRTVEQRVQPGDVLAHTSHISADVLPHKKPHLDYE